MSQVPLNAGGFGGEPLRMNGGPPTRPMEVDMRAVPRPGDSMGPRSAVPGQRVSMGNPLSRNPTNSKGGTPSQEYVVSTQVTSPWPVQRYHETQYPGSLLFHQRSMKKEENAVLTVAQMNNMLRDWRNILDSQLTKKPRTGNRFNNQPVDEPSQVLRMHIENYLLYGESYITGTPELNHKVYNDAKHKKLTVLSIEHLANSFNFLGVLATVDEQSKRRNAHILNVGHKGPTDYQPIANLWGKVSQGDGLWLILKMVRDMSSVDQTPKYFQFVPWFSDGHREPSYADRYYEDAAGIAQEGVAVFIGYVVHEPIQQVSEDARLRMAGLTVDQRTAFNAQKTNESKIVVNVGVKRHKLATRAW